MMVGRGVGKGGGGGGYQGGLTLRSWKPFEKSSLPVTLWTLFRVTMRRLLISSPTAVSSLLLGSQSCEEESVVVKKRCEKSLSEKESGLKKT